MESPLDPPPTSTGQNRAWPAASNATVSEIRGKKQRMRLWQIA